MISLVVEIDPVEGDNRLYSMQWYEKLEACVLDVLDIVPNRDITIVLIDDIHMRELNESYRGLKKTTDVLSFLYDPAVGRKNYEGELFISLPLAIRQAKRYKTTLVREVARLVVHGILHLYDYDHMKVKERVIMRGLTNKSLALARKKELC